MQKPSTRIDMPSRPMPSLNALRAFEAVARHKSLTRAAGEMNVTHGALSRHVKALEERIGVPLLRREAHGAQPTEEGARLADSLSAAFGLITAAVERVTPGPLTLSCSTSITMCWLIPRLSAFQRTFADIEIKLDMNYDRVEFARDNISIAIRNSTIEPPSSAVIRPLGTEWIGAVCSPDFLARCHLSELGDLGRAELLSTATRPSAWLDWFRAKGAPPVDRPSRSFEHFYLLVQAAACGLGVAMVPHMLALDELRSGRLVAPFGFVPGPRELSLWIAPHLAERSDLRCLEQWLVSEWTADVMRAC